MSKTPRKDKPVKPDSPAAPAQAQLMPDELTAAALDAVPAQDLAERVPLVREQIAPGQDPDFVCQLFDLLERMQPHVRDQRLDLERAVREHFRGQRYVAGRPDPGTTAARVLAMFNGHNARTVARTLGISRVHVYRILKQPGRP